MGEGRGRLFSDSIRSSFGTAVISLDLAPAFAGACFGPDLRRFALMQYHQSQTTLPRLATLLQSVGALVHE